MKKQILTQAQLHTNEIINFLESVNSFEYELLSEDKCCITQKEDRRVLAVDLSAIEKILKRQDIDGSEFLQLNFKNNTKILITRSLIGFKPEGLVGFDLTKVPRVVTTVDLKSVSVAIEELFDAEESKNLQIELDILKKVYQSILFGAERIGFDLPEEKMWISRFLLNNTAVAV